MSRMRKEVAVIEQILELKQRGMGPRAIARCLKISRNTVRRAIREKQAQESRTLELALEPIPLNEEDSTGLIGMIRRTRIEVPDGEPLPWSVKLDWGRIKTEHAKGATFKILHQEYCGSEVSYWCFWREFRKQNPKLPVVTMRLNHQPAEKTFFDFADGIDIVDRKTGEGEFPVRLFGLK
jgi:hypothetical protein